MHTRMLWVLDNKTIELLRNTLENFKTSINVYKLSNQNLIVLIPSMCVVANTYKEVSHGLGTEPDYAIVQVTLPSGIITEAVGKSYLTSIVFNANL